MAPSRGYVDKDQERKPGNQFESETKNTTDAAQEDQEK